MDFEFAVGEAVALVLVGNVNPVIEIPDEAGGLVLHVASTATAFVDFDFLVGHAVFVGVAVGPEIERVGHSDHDAVVEREDHAGEEKIVDEYGVLVVNAIAVGIFVTGDAGFRLLFTGGVGVLHVGEHFDDVESAISIPGHRDGLIDVRIAEDEFETIAVLEFDGFLGFFDREEAFLVNVIARFGKERQGGEKR